MRRHPPYGRRVNTLPHGHSRYHYHGNIYHYYNGIYYAPSSIGYNIVTAPIGFLLAALPIGFLTYYYNNIPYYYYMGTYYIWNDSASAYQVVEPPAEVKAQAEADQEQDDDGEDGDVISETSSSQQARDRYECHAWAVSESGFDPSTGAQASDNNQIILYNDSLRACLESRGYIVGAQP